MAAEEKSETCATHNVRFDPFSLRRIILHPRIPRGVFKGEDRIRGIGNWQHVKVNRTTVIDNELGDSARRPGRLPGPCSR